MSVKAWPHLHARRQSSPDTCIAGVTWSPPAPFHTDCFRTFWSALCISAQREVRLACLRAEGFPPWSCSHFALSRQQFAAQVNSAPAICSTSQFRAEGFPPCSCSHLSWWKRCKMVARNQFLEQSKLSFLLQRPVKEHSLRWTLDF